MKTISHRSTILGFVFFVSLSFLGGCTSIFGGSKIEQGVVVESVNEGPELSVAEREQRFQEAYSGGIQLVQQEQYALALGAFEEAVSLRPDSLEALFNLGACYENIGDPMKAISIYRRVLEVTPEDSDCYVNLGTSYIKMYHRENSPVWRRLARKSWEKSLQLNPDQPNVKEFLARTEPSD